MLGNQGISQQINFSNNMLVVQPEEREIVDIDHGFKSRGKKQSLDNGRQSM
jgi:hypothetical protein